MPRSDSKRRADNKYNLAHYTVLGCKMKIPEAEAFKKACKDAGTNSLHVGTRVSCIS